MAKEGFSSKVGAIAAAAGSAVGLGNIWRFPYVLGENGGAAFLLVYIAFTILIASPVLLSEFAIGRMTGKPVTAAFKQLAPKKKWYYIGLSGVLCAFVILSFYNVVAGWTLYYSYLSLTGQLAELNQAEISSLFENASSNPIICILGMLLFAGLSAFVVMRGVEKGIERYSKILMPMLFVLIIVVCIRALTLDGAEVGLSFLIKPDFSKLTPESLFVALGQAFFSLSIGMGAMTTYGAYISKKQNLASSVFSIAMIDFFVAFTAALMIFPSAFAFGINPGQGPGLVFVTLPGIFNQMAFGQLVSIVFFVLLAIAALTSTMSLLEVIVSFMSSEFGIKRKMATFIASTLTICSGIICAISSTVFNFFDDFSANVMLPLGAFFIILFVPLVLGKQKIKAELEAHGQEFSLFNIFYFLVRFIVPIAIGALFIYCIAGWLF